MKKAILSIVAVSLLAAKIEAGGRDPVIESDIGPNISASNVTIAAAGSGKKNCLTDLTVVSGSTYTVRILDGGTTDYSALLAANAGLVKEWVIDNAFCGTANTAMYISIDNGTFSINYQGFVGR